MLSGFSGENHSEYATGFSICQTESDSGLAATEKENGT
ncbi:hypothetical protein C942_04559 [Photobacterium marinum]|uniref:Uncharacterized protein n=1 Tax=Photobacterium marinum TaxID=1056511 RepID=L8JDG8_9GAMM|nr:hypothetical protein C942_04559 [Photobacterium marinum]